MIDLQTADAGSLTEALRALDWIGGDAVVCSVEPAGDGNMNVVRRLGISNDSASHSASLILKQSLDCVAKYPDIAAPADRIAVEAEFYRAVAGCADVAGHMPRVVGFAGAQRLLALEDAGNGRDFTRWYARPDPVATAERVPTPLAHWLAALHALPVDADCPDNLAMRQLNHAHIFDVPFAPDNGVALDERLAERTTLLRADAALMATVRQLGERYLSTAPDPANVRLHGDFYPGSWIERGTSDVVVLDVEFSFAGPAEFDLGVLAAHLAFCGYDPTVTEHAFACYGRPFDRALADAFAGVEVLRRLLGVAQLPLVADTDTRLGWIDNARVPDSGGKEVSLRLLIDTDVALGAWHDDRPRDIDDGFAIVEAINHPAIDLAGVTTVFGNAPHDDVLRIAGEITALKGNPVPVSPGASAALEQDQPARSAQTRNDAVEFIADALRDGPAHIAAIGPLTNIGALLLRHPDVKPAIESVVIVAGRSTGRSFFIGDRGPVRDFNFENDVAATRVLLESGVPVVMAGFELTSQVTITEADLETIRDRDDPVADYFYRNSLDWCRYWIGEFDEPGFHPWDSAAISWLTRPELFTHERRGWRIVAHPKSRWWLECDPALSGDGVTYLTGFAPEGKREFVTDVVSTVY